MSFCDIRKIRNTILVLALAALFASCSGISATAPPPSPPTQPPAHTEQPKPAPVQPTATLVADPANLTPQPTPQIVVGGRQIKLGQFTFDLRIYSDPNLNMNPSDSSQYSDLEGYGEYMTWVYQGPQLQSTVYEFWGVQPNITQLNSYRGLINGDHGGRSGGIFLPGGSYLPGSSKPGDLIKLVYRVETPQGKFGASLTFTLKKNGSGFTPTNITVRGLGAD